MERLEELVMNASAPLFLACISLPTWLPMELKKVTIHKGHVKKEGPSESLPSASADRVIITLICPHLVSSIHMIHFIVIGSSYRRDRYQLDWLTAKEMLYRPRCSFFC
jgi:hypothetical protein